MASAVRQWNNEDLDTKDVEAPVRRQRVEDVATRADRAFPVIKALRKALGRATSRSSGTAEASLLVAELDELR